MTREVGAKKASTSSFILLKVTLGFVVLSAKLKGKEEFYLPVRTGSTVSSIMSHMIFEFTGLSYTEVPALT